MPNIDFVVFWVDGNDPDWRAQRKKYVPHDNGDNSEDIRYRDWDAMKYWFRGVETFAPWVNHVYFVTCGHYPKWLNLACPKLTLVEHSQYIPEQVLPTFNSSVIELYVHKIKGLSEHFVLFNDDVFLTNHVSKNDFFKNGLPCETAVLGQITPIEWDPWLHSIVNNMYLINKHFQKQEVMKKYFRKFFSLKYGKYLFQNVLLAQTPRFSCFRDPHMPTSYLKSTFEEVWDTEPILLENSSRFRTRNSENFTEWLMKYWQICSGRFYPRSYNWGKLFTLGVDSGWGEAIRSQSYKAVCLNDHDDLNFEEIQAEMKEAFESILPHKSQFEI